MKTQITQLIQSYKTLIIYSAICIGVIFSVLLLDLLDVFLASENKTKDMRFRFRGIETHNNEIVIVAVDPSTLVEFGIPGMPPRDFHVKLIENLYKAGAKAVLFDVLFLEYSGKQEEGIIGKLPSKEDSLLAQALKKYPNTVIARKLKVEMNETTLLSSGETQYPPPLFHNLCQLAFVDVYEDNDSFTRRVKIISDDADPASGWNYSFALKAAMFASDADTAWIDTKKHLAFVGDKTIPLDKDNFMIINYAMDEQTFQEDYENGYLSYSQVFDDSEWGLDILIENNRLKDKVVLVGAAWPESGDVKFTPFYLGTTLFSKKEYPMFGVHVHKNIVTTILENRFVQPAKTWQLVFLIICMSVIATMINYRFRGFRSLLLSVAIIFVYTIAAFYLFKSHRLLIPVIAPALATIAINYVSVVTYNFLSERKQKTMIKGAFGQYVPPAVVNDLIKNPDKLTLGGEERVMTVLFSDVEGFTTISEGLTPTQLVELLNEYLTHMTNIVLSYNGIIDKYEGDAIMAEFGAPLPDDEHAVKACLTALDMQVRLVELREKLKSEGRAELRARVGINSGPMVIGNMGSNRIFDYTVMGDNVNLGSRLEGANKAYGTFIMCSDATRALAKEKIIFRELDLLRVKGKTEGVLVFEIIAKKSDSLSDLKQKALDVYHQGLDAYKERRWDEGIALFTEALSLDQDDPPSKVYIERCKEFKINPPPDDWDGIFTMRTK